MKSARIDPIVRLRDITGTFVESRFQVCQVPINSTELTRSALDKKGLFVCHIVEAESAQKSRCKQRDLVEMS